MPTTNFTAGTVVASTWLNEIDEHVFEYGHPLLLSNFTGADNTGATDSTTAINVALASASVLHLPLIVDGRFKHSSQIVVPKRIKLYGIGWTSDSSTGERSHACFIKAFNGVGFLFSGDDAVSDGVQYDAASGTTGDGVQVTGSRVRLLNGGSTNHGGDGVRIGKTEAGASSINANCGVLSHFQVLNCGGWGINFDHTNTSTSVTFPLGAPDCNAWTISHVVVGATGQPCVSGGIKFGNTIDNVVTHAVIQDNTGPAIKFYTSARGNVVTAYCEGNGSGPVFDSGAKYNWLKMTGTLITSNEAVDNDGTNTIERALSATEGWASSKVVAANLTSGGYADVFHYAGVNSDLVARSRGSVSGTSGGTYTIQTKADGGVLTDRLTVSDKGVTKTLFGFANALVFPTYGSTVTIDASLGNRFQINVTNGTAWTLATPTNPIAGQCITVCVRNTSGGAVGTITWPGIFKMSAWTSPATGYSRSIIVRYDGQYWVEEARTPADVPN